MPESKKKKIAYEKKRLKEKKRQIAEDFSDDRIKSINSPQTNEEELDSIYDDQFGQNILRGQSPQEARRLQREVIPSPPEKTGPNLSGPREEASKEPEQTAVTKKNEADKKAERKEAPETSEGQPKQKKVDGIGKQKNKAVEKLKEAGKEKILDTLKKKLTKEALKKVAVTLLANPYFWLAVGIIIVIVVIIIIFMSMAGGLANQSPNPFGASATRAVDPVEDRPSLQKALAMSGNQDIVDQMTDELDNGIVSDLVSLKDQVNDSDIAAEIDNIIALFQEAQNTKSEETAKRAISALKTLISKLENPMPVFPETSRSPLDKILGYNPTLHGGTPLNLEKVEGHNTYIHNGEGVCDAVDLLSYTGSSVYPIFGGKVVKVESDGDWGGSKVTIEKDGYEMIYAHLKNDGLPKINSSLTTNDKIGELIKDRLHLEAAYKGLCVVTTISDRIEKTSEHDWGEYLWNHYKNIFKISQ